MASITVCSGTLEDNSARGLTRSGRRAAGERIFVTGPPRVLGGGAPLFARPGNSPRGPSAAAIEAPPAAEGRVSKRGSRHGVAGASALMTSPTGCCSTLTEWGVPPGVGIVIESVPSILEATVKRRCRAARFRVADCDGSPRSAPNGLQKCRAAAAGSARFVYK